MGIRLLIVLPTAGHGGCEYNALSFGAFLRTQLGLEVIVAFPEETSTELLGELAGRAGLGRCSLPLSFAHDDDADRVEEQRRWALDIVAALSPGAVFVALPWPARGTGLIRGFADAGCPTLVKFALVPEVLYGPPVEVLPALREALGSRQIWFANSRYSASLLARHFGLSPGRVDFFHVGPIGLQAFLRNSGTTRAAVRSELGIPGGVLLVVTVGRLVEQKGYRHYLDAIASLGPELRRGLRFLWVGEGQMRGEIEAAIRARGLHELSLAGFRSDVRDVLRAADLFVLPTLYEGGSSQALLEALEEGIPSIVSGTPGVREVVEDGEDAILVEPGSAEALARALARLAGDPGLRARLSAAGRQRAQHFSAALMYARTLQRLDKLLGTDLHRHPSLPELAPDADRATARSAEPRKAPLRFPLGEIARFFGFSRRVS